MSPVATGSGGPSGPRKDSPFRPRALKRAARAESLASRAFCAVLRWASPLETTNTGTSWNEGSLITAITNPRNHAASRPKGGEPSGDDKHYPKPEPGIIDQYYNKSQSTGQLGKRTKKGTTLATVLKAAMPGVSAIVLHYFFSAEMNSFLSSLACFMIEINVPFASSG